MRPPGLLAAIEIAELATPGAPVMYGKSAFVAGGSDDDDAQTAAALLRRDGRRIVGFAERRAQAHVDHVEVIAHVAVAVGVHRPLDGERVTSVLPATSPNTFSA